MFLPYAVYNNAVSPAEVSEHENDGSERMWGEA
jgi:hypothetical protein